MSIIIIFMQSICHRKAARFQSPSRWWDTLVVPSDVCNWSYMQWVALSHIFCRVMCVWIGVNDWSRPYSCMLPLYYVVNPLHVSLARVILDLQPVCSRYSRAKVKFRWTSSKLCIKNSLFDISRELLPCCANVCMYDTSSFNGCPFGSTA